MSRHNLAPRPEQTDIVAVAIGWDRPLQTFFAQVFTRTEAEPDEGEATLWVGCEPGELIEPEAAIALVAPFAQIPDDLAARLRAERDAGAREADGHCQAEMKRRFFGSIH
jgi:hypothetical protein